MRQRIVYLCTALMLTASLWAQNSISDINRIKRDKAYLYGEATLDTKASALKLAYELLEVEIKNWALQKDDKISSVMASRIYEFADTIILQRRNMVRAFVYVKTSHLKAIKGKKLTVQVDGDQPLTKPIEPDVEQVAADEPEVAQPIIAASEPQPNDPKPTVADEVLGQLKAVDSFSDLEKTMKPLKARGKILDYGKYPTMTDPANSYLIIYDRQGQIKALLGKGTSSRENQASGAADSEKNYPGCGAIWFKVKE